MTILPMFFVNVKTKEAPKASNFKTQVIYCVFTSSISQHLNNIWQHLGLENEIVD